MNSLDRHVLAATDLARLILLHWMNGAPADRNIIRKAVLVNRAQHIVDFRAAGLREEDVEPFWDIALSIAKFTAFSMGLPVPKAQGGLPKCN